MNLNLVRHVVKITKKIMPNITTIEESNGCDLLMDTGVDTYCAGKHAYVLAIIEGISVFVGFSVIIFRLKKIF